MRAGLVKRWQKAEMERPDGAGFHAWKHVLVESVVRYRRSVAAVGIAGLLTFSTACAGGQDMGNNSPEITSSPSPSISQTAAPAGPSIAGGEVIKTDKGEYLQSTIADDDPVLAYNPDIVTDDAKAAFNEKDLQDAKHFAVKYTAEELIDSPLNNNASSFDSWWETHQNLFSAEYREEIKGNIQNKKGPILHSEWQEERKDTYSYVYSPNETRMYDRLISVNKESILPDGKTVVVEGDFSYKAKVKNPSDPSVGYATESTSGTYRFGVVKDPNAPDGWSISGFEIHSTVDDVSAGIK
ncbi:MAG: hypothetical protein H9W81_12795 [Enterococcus sp.]|nr:hypothetical protein [Enterococcus sp.]